MIHAREDYNSIQDNTNAIELAKLLLAYDGLQPAAKILAQKIINGDSNKIPENEPVFLIRAQDDRGAEIVRHWARLNKYRANDAIVNLALGQADKMEAWPFKKVPDLK